MSDEKAEQAEPLSKDQDFHHDIVPRRASFGWERTPPHWIPDEPIATHVINVLHPLLHLLLRAGEGPPRHARRVGAMTVTAPAAVPAWLWMWMWMWSAARYLIRHDPKPAGRLRCSLKEHNVAVAKGLLPTWRELDSAIPRYFKRSYHPSQEGSPRRAVDHLATSPEARAAAGAIGRRAAL